MHPLQIIHIIVYMSFYDFTVNMNTLLLFFCEMGTIRLKKRSNGLNSKEKLIIEKDVSTVKYKLLQP